MPVSGSSLLLSIAMFHLTSSHRHRPSSMNTFTLIRISRHSSRSTRFCMLWILFIIFYPLIACLKPPERATVRDTPGKFSNIPSHPSWILGEYFIWAFPPPGYHAQTKNIAVQYHSLGRDVLSGSATFAYIPNHQPFVPTYFRCFIW